MTISVILTIIIIFKKLSVIKIEILATKDEYTINSTEMISTQK